MAVLGALACALAIVAAFQVAWWHPYCDTQADGPGYYGRGFPLPFVAPSGAASLTYIFMPHVLLLNLALLSGALFLVVRRLGRGLQVAVVVVFGLAAIAFAAPQILVGDYRPVLTLGGGYDSGLSYRPAWLMERSGHQACDSLR